MTPHQKVLAASLVLTACLPSASSRADDPPPAPAPVKPGDPLRPAPQAADEKTAAESASEKERLERHARIEKLFGPEIWDVKDGTDLAEEPQWRKALDVLAGLDPKFVDENADYSLNGRFDVVMKDPAAFRGRFVRMRGVVGRKSYGAVKLAEPIAGRSDVYRGQIADDADDSPVVFFDLPDRPPEFRLQYDEVEIVGIFYRTVKFETRAGKTVEAPWIIGRTLVVRGTGKFTGPADLPGSALPDDGNPAAKPPVAPAPAPKPDDPADVASDAKARAILAKAAELQNAGDLAEPGKLDSFHVVFHKATFERTTTTATGQTSQLVETDEDGLVFDWMKGSVRTEVTIDGKTTTKAWYEPMEVGWIYDGTSVSSLLGDKYKSDYDQLQFHRTVVNQLLDVALLGKLLRDKSRWRVVTDAASPAHTVAIERIPPADVPGAVAIRLWIANPSDGVYGDVVAASMPPTAENAATVFYDFRYDALKASDEPRELFPKVRVKTGDAAPADAALRFPFVVTVHELREGSAERTKVLEVFTRSVDINTVVDAAFQQPRVKK